MSLKEFKFLSKYKDEKSFLNQVASVLWLQNDELVKKRGYTYNEYGEIEKGLGANYYNNLALEYGKAQTALKKWFYYIQKANKQAQRFFNKKELEDLEPVSLNANALSKETEALTQSVESGHKQSTTIAKTDEQSIAENGIKDNKQAFLQFIKIMQDTKNGDFYPSENLQNALEKSGKKARENALELFTKEYESKDAKLVELLKNIQEPRIASKALSLIKHFTQARMMQSAIKAVPSDILMKYVNIDASQRLEVLSSLYGDFSNIMKEVALKGKKIPDPAALSEKGGAYVFNRQYRKILNIYEKIQENEELLRLLAHKNDYKTTIEIIQESKAKGLSVKQTKEAIEENKKQTAKLFDEVIRQENKPSVKPLDEFGINYEGFKGKEAIDKLLSEKRGQVKGAFYKEGLGEIDLVWGNKDYGLEHILNKHGDEFEDIAAELDEIIAKGEVVKDNDRATLKYIKENGDIFKIGLKGNWKGETTQNKWIITAYKYEREMAKTINSSDFTKGETLPLNSNESIAENEAKKSLFESSENFYDYHKKLLHEVNLEGLDKQNAKDKLYFNTFQTYMKKVGNFEKELLIIINEVRPFLRLNEKDKIIDKLFRLRDNKDFTNSLKELVYLYVHKDKLGIDDIHTATKDYVESMAKYVKGLLPYDNQPSFEKLVKEKKLFDEVIRQENKPSVKPLDEFGVNFEGFKGKEAINKLLEEQRGQVAGAFYKEGLGEIDLVWGDEKIGLKKIIEKHLSDFENFEGKDEAEKMVNALNEIIENGKIITENGINTLWLKKDDEYYLIGLSRGWSGKGENEWIITSYKKTKGKIPDELKGDTANLSAYSDEFNPLLTSKDEPLNSKDIIPQQKIKFAMEKFHYDEKKAKDLLEWHKNSHALTKDENGLPKVFYHGTYSKFRVFRRVGKASGQGFFFTPSQKATEEYGDITLNTFLNIKNPFRADELKINKEADLQKWADILKLDYDKEKYESFKDLKTKLEKVKEATKKAGFKFHSASGGGVYVIDNKGRNSFINLEELDKENKRVVEAFKGLETEDIYFYYVVRNEFDLVLYALNKNDRYFHTSGRDEVKRVLEKLGYDGAVLNDTIITVFNSNQIKHIDNKGSFTDTKGNVTSKKPKDKEVEFSYFNEKS
ncbi:DUF3519 domain-containing protein, partial [Campylobacter upsaliensis]|nr:DUF3519 domain-containing protein [Campylobacter upsaliensis]